MIAPACVRCIASLEPLLLLSSAAEPHAFVFHGGAVSAANGGPNTNSGHFSVVVSPAPHLNGARPRCACCPPPSLTPHTTPSSAHLLDPACIGRVASFAPSPRRRPAVAPPPQAATRSSAKSYPVLTPCHGAGATASAIAVRGVGGRQAWLLATSLNGRVGGGARPRPHSFVLPGGP